MKTLRSSKDQQPICDSAPLQSSEQFEVEPPPAAEGLAEGGPQGGRVAEELRAALRVVGADAEERAGDRGEDAAHVVPFR